MPEETANENKISENAYTDSLKVDQLPLTGGTDEVLSSKADTRKVDILLKATGDAPIMKKKRWAVDREKKIGSVIEFVKKFLRIDQTESLFLYVNQSFAPSPDQIIKNLYDCFGSDGKLILYYCKSQAWG